MVHPLDGVTFNWWANGNHHRAYNATRGFHGRMVAYSDKYAKTFDLVVGPIEERWTKPAAVE